MTALSLFAGLVAIAAASPPADLSPVPPGLIGGRARRASARVPLEQLHSDKDYPAAAVRARQQGAVDFRLDIDRRGRVRGCTILASSGSTSLDSTTCRLMKARARFEPARNVQGEASADRFTGRLVWSLAAEDQEP